MEWSACRVSLRIISPIHIGWKKAGNSQQTRPYLLAKTIWGALTARLARDYGNFDYKGTGQKVFENLRFTYFYPTTNKDKVDLFPWGPENFDYFSWKYLNSYQNTALNYKLAEEGSLHETEYISPKTRENEQVYLLGYVFEKSCSDLKWRDSLEKVQFGGERGYGWGKVKVSEICNLQEKCFDNYIIDLNNDTPIITTGEKCPVLAHTLAKGIEFKGQIEPFVGRETSKKDSFGNKFSVAKICWVPGSISEEEKRFEILPDGLWKPVY